MPGSSADEPSPRRQRRRRYPGKHPRRFEDKYKERNPEQHPETVSRVLESGKTPAGTHRPIMVEEVLRVLMPRPGEIAVDCTLGYGGHAMEILPRLRPGGRLLGFDRDAIELVKTEARLRTLGYGPAELFVCHSSFAGFPQVLTSEGLPGTDILFADLGVSSMQLDDPSRGFSLKQDGPLDMRMNPQRGPSASEFLAKAKPEALSKILSDYADEPRAVELAATLAGRQFLTTLALVTAIRSALPRLAEAERQLSIRRVFQAVRIAVNDEFSALDTLLRHAPSWLNPGGRIAILTFHSGEDRRVKKAFSEGLRQGVFADISHDVLRPSAEERYSNPRSSPAKLRWARMSSEPRAAPS